MDFNLPEGMVLDKQKIQQELDRLIAEDHAVNLRLTTGAALKAQPELVKTMPLRCITRSVKLRHIIAGLIRSRSKAIPTD